MIEVLHYRKNRHKKEQCQMIWNKEKLVVFTYDGYHSRTRLFVVARVLSDFTINWENESKFSLFNASIRRWYTNELKDVQVEVTYLGKTIQCTSNSEGFIVLDMEWKADRAEKCYNPISYKVVVVPKKRLKIPEQAFTGRIFYNGLSPKTAIISDIDDTILHTDVLSKRRMVYNSVFLSFQKRLAIKNSSRFLEKIRNHEENPIFYISNSPYNLYFYLQKFLGFNLYPQGPLFLRDFGRRNTIIPYGYASHKHFKISRLLEAFPDTQFVLVGDGAEHDPQVYFEMKEKYHGRIEHIFLRLVGSAKHKSVVRKWHADVNDPFMHIFEEFTEAEQIAKELRLFK